MPQRIHIGTIANKQSRSLLSKAFNSFIKITLLLTIINVLAVWLVVVLLNNLELKEHETSAQAHIKVARDLAHHDFESVISDLQFLVHADPVVSFAENKTSSLHSINDLFTNLANTHQLYDQVRLIDEQGMEVVRVDWRNGVALKVKSSNLQNKSGRYYFTETASLKKNEIFVSPLDLNIENDQIEKPYKPMIRFGMPLYNSENEFRGVIVLNYLAAIMLERFRGQMDLIPGKGVLLNTDGYWLSEPTNTKEWGFMFDSKHTFADEEPLLWPEIQRNEEGILENANGQFVFSTIKPFEGLKPSGVQRFIDDWKVIVVNKNQDELVKMKHFEYLYPLLIIYPIGLLLIWKWAKASAGRKMAETKLKKLNHTLERKVRDRTQELTVTKDVTIHSLASLAETRDNETGQHIRRTQHYVRVLALDLLVNNEFVDQLSEERINLIFKSAPLHDIGKVGIPDRILLKPGRLTDEEFNIMKTHATLGGDALDGAIKNLSHQLHIDTDRTFLFYARNIARYHHERWDGKGYPDRLKGEDIPLSARLMALADVYDALVSERVYKPAFGRDKTERILLRESEGQFDPRILASFERIRDEFWSIRNKYTDQALTENQIYPEFMNVT
jgi:response regulator RpfG family c-di-GMP phosphodiesterase